MSPTTAVQAPISYVSPRARFALIVPATNTVVEAEFGWMSVPGISWHSGRIEISNPSLKDDATMVAFLEQLRGTIGAAVDSVRACLPTYMVMGMSAETFWGGQEGASQFEQFMIEKSGGLKVTTGALAAKAALDLYGAKKIGIITPYQAVGDQQVSIPLQARRRARS
jgi:maleate isomerase